MQLPRTPWAVRPPLCRRGFWGFLLTVLYLLTLVTAASTQREEKNSHRATGLQSKLKNTKQNKKPAAHFEGDPYTHGSLLWRSDTANTFARGGLTLRNNTLHVASAGLYFVYTQASFLGRGCPRTGGPVSLSHGVALLSDQYPQEMPLLSTGKTACRELAGQTSRPPAAKPGPDPADRTWARAIFQGGTFALEEGDVLHTVTEGGEYLRLGPGEAFFGAYAL